MRLEEYVDFTIERNGYKDALKYLTKKERPPSFKMLRSLENSMRRGELETEKKKKAKLSVSGINLSTADRVEKQEKHDLASKLI